MPDGLPPLDLLKTAGDLLASSNGRPRQTNLRRATSTAYYALFHCLATCCADLLIGGPGSRRSQDAWTQVYRALEHGFAGNACKNQQKIARFPQQVQDFASTFATMQAIRHKADYDPTKKFYKSDVRLQIAVIETIILEFERAPMEARRAFAAYVLLKERVF